MHLTIVIAALTVLTLGVPPVATGHGNPIELGTIDGVLTVGHPDDNYAPLVIGQRDEESDPQGPLNHPVLGRTLLWGLPGIDITGMADSASLSLEVFAPTGIDGSPQTLWYWRATTQTIEPSSDASELRVLLADGSFLALKGTDNAAPVPTEIVSPVAGQTGYHNHGLMNFAMPYDPATLETGLYGFFARFTSDMYAPSDRFLALFNVGADYDDLVPASDAMWGAAFPGDYDRNDRIGITDADAWAAEYGSTPEFAYGGTDGNGDGLINAADYTVWRDQISASASAIPEPTAATLLVIAGVGIATEARRARP